MRRRWIARGLLATVLGCPNVPAGADGPAPWQGPANAWIASHARRVGGQAPRERRLSCEGDLNGDGLADVVVVYTVEGASGGNDWAQYATVLAGSAQQFVATPPVKVGARGERAVDSCAVAPAGVALASKEWMPADPACCPSRPGRSLSYRFEKGTLVEVPAPVPSAS